MEELEDIIETGIDAGALDIDHGTALADTSNHPEPASEPVQAVKLEKVT
jgi:hypothetical protein